MTPLWGLTGPKEGQCTLQIVTCLEVHTFPEEFSLKIPVYHVVMGAQVGCDAGAVRTTKTMLTSFSNRITLMFPNQINLRKLLRTLPMAKRYSSDYSQFQKVLNQSQNIVALTGAGVSAESGIPVFRGAGGLWRTHRATDLATPQAFKANPALVWEFYHYRREVAFNSQPNNAHKALAMYEQQCKAQNKQFTLITQNVDGLHKRAGSENVIELHGSLTQVICTKCKKIEENLNRPICEALQGRGDPAVNDIDLPLISVKGLPKCSHCQSLARPYIVWFGENLDRNVLNKSREVIESCDFCLIIGTSSVVYPAAMFAPTVAERGKPVAEFNLTDDPADENFAFHFSGPCGTTLPKALGIDL